MNIDAMFPSRFMRALDLDGPLTLTITRIVVAKLTQGETKPVVYFAEASKGFGAEQNRRPRTSAPWSAQQISEDSIGRKITLVSQHVMFRNRLVPTMRVRRAGGNDRRANGRSPTLQDGIA